MPKHAILFADSDSEKNHLKGLEIHFFNNPDNLPECITPEIPSCADPKEILVSEAMKRACNHNQKVIIIGVNKDDVVEKNIECKYFNHLIEFMPEPVYIPDLFLKIQDDKNKNKICCVRTCSADITKDKKNSNIYAGTILFLICHELKKKKKEKLSGIKDAIETLKKLFIPQHNGEFVQVQLFLSEIANLTISLDCSQEEFKNKTESVINKFPYFPEFRKEPIF